jgi:hypothetical protein
MSEGDWYLCPQRMSDGASLREEKVRPDCTLTKNRPEGGLERLVELSTMFNRSTATMSCVCPLRPSGWKA